MNHVVPLVPVIHPFSLTQVYESSNRSVLCIKTDRSWHVVKPESLCGWFCASKPTVSGESCHQEVSCRCQVCMENYQFVAWRLSMRMVLSRGTVDGIPHTAIASLTCLVDCLGRHAQPRVSALLISQRTLLTRAKKMPHAARLNGALSRGEACGLARFGVAGRRATAGFTATRVLNAHGAPGAATPLPCPSAWTAASRVIHRRRPALCRARPACSAAAQQTPLLRSAPAACGRRLRAAVALNGRPRPGGSRAVLRPRRRRRPTLVRAVGGAHSVSPGWGRAHGPARRAGAASLQTR